MIERTEYLEQLKRFKDKDLIKVVTGIRRCGKSTLFEIFINYLKETGTKDEQIIKINLEDASYDFKDYKELYDYVNEKLDSKKQYYVFLDEVQNVSMFQKAVDSLYIKKNVDVYITGSNAYLLSGELATLLSGRYAEIKMLPLSFKEYLSVFNDSYKSRYEYFLDYMRNGGMPGNIPILKDNPNDLDKYLDGIFSTIVYKDIITRNNVTDKMLLESVLRFIFDSIGSPISTKKISDTLTSKGMSTSNHTVEKYISAFVESFLIYKAERFDVKGKNLLMRDYKYYVVDQGLRSYLLGKKADSDMGHILENIVYFELLRRGYDVAIGKMDDAEIDFIATKYNEKIYVQVTESLISEKTRNRELLPLQKVKDNYKKMILSLDDLETSEDGIELVNVIKWLVESGG